MAKSNKKKYDFSGYATKVGLKCSDGRTILHDAFADCDGKTVPLVYQHMHNDPKNILGHALLENRKDGVYAYCSLNETDSGKTAKALVQHGDITALSIYANSLVEKAKNVIHGVIREVSIVIAGANPEAYIDNLAFEHGDGSITTDETEAIICVDVLSHDGIDVNEEEEPIVHADAGKQTKETVGDVFETFNEKQKSVVYALIAHALEASEEEDDDEGEEDNKGGAGAKDGKAVKHSNNEKGESTMKKNILTRLLRVPAMVH
jgi:HK97 family phage prohead protease